jgi:predicted Zn-dependent peptidase/LysM repeat protein
VAVCVTYDVGARDEVLGQRGFAHLFEHMMFEGSRNVEKGDHFKLVAGHGGHANGTTSSERTNFFEELPSGDLELALWLEADRMRSLAVNQETFENQRSVVEEEYRMRVSNRPYAAGFLRLNELAFQGYPTYGHTAIGSMEDLDAARIEWVQAFHEKYYVPANAVVTVSGDFDSARARELVEQYFGDIERAPAPERPALPPTPRQTSERLSVLEDTNAKTPGLYLGWLTPPAKTPAHYALELAARVLADGESSALHQSLVRKDAVARSSDARVSHHRGPSLFSIRTVIAPKSSIDKAQKLIEAELKRLGTVGPTAEELDRARARLRSSRWFELQQSERRAVLLGEYESVWGDASLLTSELERYDAVTAADVKRAVAEHITPERRTIVEVYPPGWVRDEYPAILQHAYIVKKGDSLIRIANAWGVALSDLLKDNELRRNQTIYPGQKLIIPKGGHPPGKARRKRRGRKSKARAHRAPKPRSHKVRKGDTLSEIAKRYGVSVADIMRQNRIGPKKRIYIGKTLVIPPKKAK